LGREGEEKEKGEGEEIKGCMRVKEEVKSRNERGWPCGGGEGWE
jgi:hypothetical protein